MKLYYDSDDVNLVDLNESMAKKKLKQDVNNTKDSIDRLSTNNVSAEFTFNDVSVDDAFNKEFDNTPEYFYDSLDKFPNFPDIHINENVEEKHCSNFPSEEYKKFMILITKYNISHSLGNEILKLIKKHSKPNFIFPISTKSGKEILDKMKV